MKIRLVLDSNILFTYFWKKAAIHLILEKGVTAYTPQYALKEIGKYRSEICKKATISEAQFVDALETLKQKVRFVPDKDYSGQNEQVRRLLDELPDHERKELACDAEFLALAQTLRYPLWSNDKLLKTQGAVKVFSTAEIIELLGG